jgi:tetratricopeptide (TPR) repeat protein
MSMVSLPAPHPGPQPARSRPVKKRGSSSESTWGLFLIDASLLVLFLALTFLLAIFPLKDVDFHWHLRTGDLIRKTGQIPRVDFYTFTRQGVPWIDLHWMFQVGISWIYERGGVPALTLAKAVITCLAVFLLVTARRRTWPVWAMVLAWLPALLLLGGRMYVRPETLSLLYLAIFLAVICRWEGRPWLAWTLPVVQVVWVNSHGLFVLGPIVLAFALVDAVFRRGAFAHDRRRWWQIVVPAGVATGLACLLNPYGIHGAMYPLELAGTMSNPIFSQKVAELMPIPKFIEESGLGNLLLQLHLFVMVLGALSFLLPIFWLAWARLSRSNVAMRNQDEPGDEKSTRTGKGKKKRAARRAIEVESGWRISPFRFLLYVAFSALSLQATRNSHQFAAVVGAVTSWNFAEWAAAWRRHRADIDRSPVASSGLGPRLLTLVSVSLTLLLVGSGQFYAVAGEGRTIGWGEEPLWFPHAAAKFAGSQGMPERFLSFHNGLASLFEYYHSPERPGGPGRTVFTDPRLEIAGPELFGRYQELGKNIAGDKPGWEDQLDQIGRPTVLVDHQVNSQLGASLLASRHWKCVWFDPIVAVFVHDSYDDVVRTHAVDFGTRHFRPDPATEPHDPPALAAAAKALRDYLSALASRPEIARPLLWLAQDYSRRVIEAEPDSPAGWKSLGQTELLRDSAGPPSPRFRMPFDPVFDLTLVRATYQLRRAMNLAPRDFSTVFALEQAFRARQMDEASLPIIDRLASLYPINPYQRKIIEEADKARPAFREKLGPTPPTTWKNLGELDEIVSAQLSRGRAATAAQILEQAYPAARAPWDVIDRVATLHLHLGEPEKARGLWRQATTVLHPAVRDAHIAATHLVEGHFDLARQAYEQALGAEPSLFEARYGLAILEQDAGRAAAALENARAAIESAPNDVSRSAARAIASAVSRYARREASGL